MATKQNPKFNPNLEESSTNQRFIFEEPNTVINQQTGQTAEPTKPVTLLSSARGETAVDDRQQKLSDISAGLEEAKKQALALQETAGKLKSEEPTEPPPPVGISAADILSSDGVLTDYDKQADGTYLPKEEKSDLEIEIETSRNELANAKTDYQNAVSNLENMDISQDPAFQGIIKSITSAWDTRINEMQRINESREQALTQRGIRIGGRYTTSIGGIISAEERAGLGRVSELEASKQSAITSATSAFRKQKWDEYVKFVDIAEKQYDDQLAAIEKLNEVAIEQAKLQQEKAKESDRDVAISFLADQGATPSEILSKINEFGDYTAKEVGDTLKSLGLDEGTASSLSGKAKDFQSFIDIGLIDPTKTKVEQWKDYVDITTQDKQLSVAEAEKLGVPFGTTESEAYGKVPVKTGDGELSNKTILQIDKIRTEFNNSPITKNFQQVQNKLVSVANIIDFSFGGPADLALVFEFMKSLDPTSVVRESEYDVAAKSGNPMKQIAAKIGGYFSEGQFLPEEVKEEFRNIVKIKYDASLEEYKNLRSENARLIDIKTKDIDGTNYLVDFETTTAKNLFSKEKEPYIADSNKGQVDLTTYEEE